MPPTRATVTFRGHVQGVGFRWAVRRLAANHPVTGWVRNEPDGSVRAVIEGDRASIDSLLADIRRQMTGHISSESLIWASATGEFTVFDIRH